jgi:hypothetical protein
MGVFRLVEQLGALIQYFLCAVMCSSPKWKSAPAKEASEEIQSMEIPAPIQDNEEDYQEEDEDEDEMDLETLELLPFQPAIRLIDLEALRDYALAVRINQVQTDEGLSQASDQLTCSIDDKPLHGGFNIVYLIHFSDGHRWVARIPINAPNFGSLDKKKMDSEYHTMRHRRNTLQLPIPEIHTWETNSNTIGTPFALMSWIDGLIPNGSQRIESSRFWLTWRIRWPFYKAPLTIGLAHCALDLMELSPTLDLRSMWNVMKRAMPQKAPFRSRTSKFAILWTNGCWWTGTLCLLFPRNCTGQSVSCRLSGLLLLQSLTTSAAPTTSFWRWST